MPRSIPSEPHAIAAPRRALVALLLALLPLAAHAEGARLLFDCVGDDGSTARFVISPDATDASGKGRIEVSYRGETYPGVAASDHGPFQFGTETEHFALLIEGVTDDGKLTAHLHHATATSSILIPYTCETNL
jgi:hypothetical protein